MEEVQLKNRTLSSLGRPTLDIEFYDLSYVIPAKNGRKHILKSISGQFRSGELSAILGPSGAGKSTLMNILMGTIYTNVTGSILVNGQPRDMEKFNRQTTYIMQEDLLQPHITVQEFMSIAANLKMSAKNTREERLARVNEVLDMLDLSSCKDTNTETLSGGQRKRLSVALELVSNPPVIFLDEPTTGLDSSATKHMMKVLSLLAQQGRTIVCTIHQPSATLFNQFNQIYVVARGQCVYQGEPRDLVPFLEDSGMYCPTTHNPADFILEAVQGENTANVILLSGEMLNGKLNWRPTMLERDTQHFVREASGVNMSHKVKIKFPVSSFQQFYIILGRMMLQQVRNKIGIFLQTLFYVGVSLIVGVMFFNLGNDANHAFTNFRFILCVNVCFMYSSMLTPVLIYPSELRILRREYLNRWYGLKPYFIAQLVSKLPAHMIFVTTFSLISYLLGGHPLELHRIALFTVFALSSALVAEGHGMVVGTLCSEVTGSIISPATLAPLLVMSIIGMGYSQTEPVMTVLRGMSFMRYAMVGLSLSVFGMNRSDMHCSEIYCHYQDPKMLLKDLGMAEDTIIIQLIMMASFYAFYRLVAFLALRYRMSLEFSLRIEAFIHRFLRRKSSSYH